MVVAKLSTYPDFTNIPCSVTTMKPVHAIAALG